MASSSWTRSAAVACLGVAALVVVSSPAAAQRKPRIATAAQPPAPPPAMYPFFGVTDLRTAPAPRQHVDHSQRRHDGDRAPVVIYVPVPVYGPSPYAEQPGRVYDTSGRPLYGPGEFDPATNYAPAVGTPDLSGSPYTTTEGGVMVVAFANGVRRSVPACAAEGLQKTPDGQPRTVFFQSASAGVILPAGDSGRVRGEPGGAEHVCYTIDSFGRLVLAF